MHLFHKNNVLKYLKFVEYPVRASFYTFFTACAIHRIFDNNMLVPQKAHFADYLLLAGCNTFPTSLAFARIYPHVRRVQFT
jgi:hypothetical protein